MFNVKNYEYECTRKCRHQEHGKQITAALTRRSLQDEKLAAFIAKCCANFADIVDDLGRSALHMTASVGRYELLEWLLNQGAIINGRDFESGNSALHRAIYYGFIDCAVLLMRYGASLELLDEDGRCALQNVCRYTKRKALQHSAAVQQDLLVWGSNKNNNLGIGNETAANAPTYLDYFRKEHISIKRMALGTYHSLFLDSQSRVFAVGHGEGGRLGLGIEKSLPEPKRVKLPIKNDEDVIDISVSRNHSLLLTNRSSVFACGLNVGKQLGVRAAADKLTSFKQLVTLRDLNVQGLKAVLARDMHSLTYSENALYFWGTNNGQMGLESKQLHVELPMQPKQSIKGNIRLVESNDAATVIVSSETNLTLFYNYKVRMLSPPNYEKIKSVCIVGGDTLKSSKGSATALKLLLLTDTNVLFLWYENTQLFYSCQFSQLRLSQFDMILYKTNQLFILSQGDVYMGKCTQIAVPAILRKDEQKQKSLWNRFVLRRSLVSTEHMMRIDLRRLTEVDRATYIACNEDFTAFAVLQEANGKYFELPELPQQQFTFKKLFNDANEFDAVHDVVFHVEADTFAAHKFICSSRSRALKDIIKTYLDKHIYLNFDNFSSKIFELLLKHIYNNHLPNAEDIKDIQQSLGPEKPATLQETCTLFMEQAEKFNLPGLVKYLKKNIDFHNLQELFQPYELCRVDLDQYRPNRLNRKSFPAFHDVRILCADEQELLAHKCVLVGRLEFFDMMFSHSWSEQHHIDLSTISIEYMEPIIDFLYNYDVEQFRKQNHSEAYLYNMIVYCDQFFIEQLRKICELLLLEKLSIRKCGDILNFAYTYNCNLLKRGCFDYICQNLARFLLHRSLEHCEPEALKGLSEHYREMFKEVFAYRQITPDSSVDEELLLSFADDFVVNLQYRMNETQDFSNKSNNNSSNKTPSQENKIKQATRQHELAAISSMKQTMNFDERNRTHSESKSRTLSETQETAEKLQAESRNWIKVLDKKEHIKKLPLESVLKAHELLKNEEKPKANFVPLQKAVTPEKEEKPMENSSTPVKSYNFNLADFTPSREKLSQKQRKRLSSNSETANISWRSAATLVETKPIAMPARPNAWGITANSADSFNETNMCLTGSSQDPTSFANMMRGQSVSPGTSNNTSHNSNSFSKILAEERKQRDYYERMRNKSLVLTQIEEKAIAELREFYNVDNVTDEVITIERKSVPSTMNFAVWHHQ